MAKISFVLVFAFAFAFTLPVLGQEDWKDLLGQGGFTQDSLNKAQLALGAASAQAAMNDYFGGDDSSSGSLPEEPSDEGEGSSLADILDTVNTSNEAGISPTGSIVDSPIGAPEDLPADDVDDDFYAPVGAPEISFSPAEAPLNSPIEAPESAPSTTTNVSPPESAPPTTNASPPESAPPTTTNAPTESPESAPTTNAPTGEPDDEDEFDDSESAPSNAPTHAPEAEPADDSDLLQ